MDSTPIEKRQQQELFIVPVLSSPTHLSVVVHRLSVVTNDIFLNILIFSYRLFHFSFYISHHTLKESKDTTQKQHEKVEEPMLTKEMLLFKINEEICCII